MSKENRTRFKTFPAALKQACEGLNFVSETDSGVTPVFGERPRSTSTADVLAAIGVSAPESVEETEFERFFSRLSDEKAWFAPEQRTNAKRFDALKRLLETELSDLKVFRIGKIRLTIYALGSAADGKIAGVKMDAIET